MLLAEIEPVVPSPSTCGFIQTAPPRSVSASSLGNVGLGNRRCVGRQASSRQLGMSRLDLSPSPYPSSSSRHIALPVAQAEIPAWTVPTVPYIAVTNMQDASSFATVPETERCQQLMEELRHVKEKLLISEEAMTACNPLRGKVLQAELACQSELLEARRSRNAALVDLDIVREDFEWCRKGRQEVEDQLARVQKELESLRCDKNAADAEAWRLGAELRRQNMVAAKEREETSKASENRLRAAWGTIEELGQQLARLKQTSSRQAQTTRPVDVPPIEVSIIEGPSGLTDSSTEEAKLVAGDSQPGMLQAQVLLLQASVADLQSDADSWQTEVMRQRLYISQLEAELSALRATEEQARRVIEASAWGSHLKVNGQSTEAAQLQAQVSELKAHVADAQIAAERHRVEMAQCREYAAQLEAEQLATDHNTMRPQDSALGNEIEASHGQATAMQAQKASELRQQEIDALQAQVLQLEADRAAKEAQATAAEQASVAELEMKAKSHSSEVANLHAQIVELVHEATALKAQTRSEPYSEVRHLQMQVSQLQAEAAAREAQAREAAQASNDELQRKARTYSTELSELKSQIAHMQASASEAQAQLESREAEVQQSRTQILKLQAEVTTKEAHAREAAQFELKATTYHEEASELRSQVMALQAEVNAKEAQARKVSEANAAELEQKVTAYSDNVAGLLSQIEKLQATASESREKSESRQLEIKVLQTQVSQLEAEASKQAEAKEVAQVQTAEFEKKITSYCNEVAELRSQISELQAAAAASEARAQVESHQHAALEVRTLMQQLEATASQAQLDSEARECEAEELRLQIAHLKAEASENDLQAQGAVQVKAKSYSDEVEVLQSQVLTLQAELIECRYSEAQADAESREKKLTDLRATVQELQVSAAEAQASCEVREKELAELQAGWASCQRELLEQRARVQELEATVLQERSSFESLERELHGLQVKLQDSKAEVAAKEVQAKDIEQAKASSCRAEVAELRSCIVALQMIDSALKAERRTKVVRGLLQQVYARVSEEDARSSTAAALESEEEGDMEEIVAELETWRQSALLSREEVQRARAEWVKLGLKSNVQIQSLRRQLSALRGDGEAQIIDHERQMSLQRRRLEEEQERIASLQAELCTLKDDNDLKDRNAFTSAREIDELLAQVEALRRSRDEQRQAVDRLDSTRAELDQQLQLQQSDVEVAQNRLVEVREELARARTDWAEARIKWAQELDEAKDACAALRKERDDLAAEIGTLRQTIAERDARLVDQTVRLDARRTQTMELDQKILDLTQAHQVDVTKLESDLAWTNAQLALRTQERDAQQSHYETVRAASLEQERRYTAQLEEEMQKVAEEKSGVEEMVAELASLKVEREALAAELEALQVAASKREQELTEMRIGVAEEQQRVRLQEQDLSTAKVELESAAMANSWEVDSLKEEISALILERDQSKIEMERLRNDIATLRSIGDEASVDRSATGVQLQAFSAELNQLRRKSTEENDALTHKLVLNESDRELTVKEAEKWQRVAAEKDDLLQEEQAKSVEAIKAAKLAQEEIQSLQHAFEQMSAELMQKNESIRRQLEEVEEDRDRLLRELKRSKEIRQQEEEAEDFVEEELQRIQELMQQQRWSIDPLQDSQPQPRPSIRERSSLKQAIGGPKRATRKSVKFAAEVEEEAQDKVQDPALDADAAASSSAAASSQPDATKDSAVEEHEEPTHRGHARAGTWQSGTSRTADEDDSDFAPNRLATRATTANIERSSKKKETRSFGIGKMWKMNVAGDK